MTTYDDRTALVVVDMQNDFAHPDGSLWVSGGQDVIAFVNEQIERARDSGSFLVYSQDWHPARTPHFQKDGGIWPVHCIGGTWGAAFHDDVVVDENAAVLRKGVDGRDGYSAFSVRDPRSGDVESTQLETVLRDAEVEHIVVVGLATDYCVKETVLDARRLGFEATALVDGMRAVNLETGDGDRAIDAMRDAGAKIE